MNRVWTSATFAAALGCAATLSGQAGTQTAAQQSGGDAHRTVTVVGCVQRSGGTDSPTGTAGVAGAGSTGTGSTGWILANASTTPAATAEPAGAPNSTPGGNTTANANREAGAAAGAPTAGAPVAAAPGGTNREVSGSTYILEPGTKPGSQDLSAHAGHKVEITGTLAGSPAATSGAATASPSTETGRATSATSQTSPSLAGAMPASQRLQVASVKMISQTCS
jgi:hypothetical protein